MGGILDGKGLADKIKQALGEEIKQLNKAPGLAVIMVGDDPGSKSYVTTAQKACEQLGIHLEFSHFTEEVLQGDITDLIQKLNGRSDIHGILLQSRLPSGIDRHAVMDSINPYKDVDGLGRENRIKLYRGQYCLEPCVPKGIITLLDHYKIPIEGQHVVIINRSHIVGQPLYYMMLQRGAALALCHSKTGDLSHHTKQADILISAIGESPNGKAPYITKGMVKEGAVVIDLGFSRVSGIADRPGKIVGDVDFDNVRGVVRYITPVRGGVGPVTVAMLMQNTLKAYHMLRGAPVQETIPRI